MGVVERNEDETNARGGDAYSTVYYGPPGIIVRSYRELSGRQLRGIGEADPKVLCTA